MDKTPFAYSLSCFLEFSFFYIKIQVKQGAWEKLVSYNILTLDFFAFQRIAAVAKISDSFFEKLLILVTVTIVYAC